MQPLPRLGCSYIFLNMKPLNLTWLSPQVQKNTKPCLRIMSGKMTSSTKPTTRSRASTTSPKAFSTPAPKCYLVTIPPEVRDSILRHLLLLPELTEKPSETHDGPWSLYFTHNTQGRTRLWNRGDRSRTLRDRLRALELLTQTCKMLYFESVALFYASHSYHFDCANSCT